jgi:26S proteasome regulatory subunit N12
MRLLSENRIADFHCELELVPCLSPSSVAHTQVSSHSHLYIKYPLQLEQFLMEGAYNKILNARMELPSQHFEFFLDVMTDSLK